MRTVVLPLSGEQLEVHRSALDLSCWLTRQWRRQCCPDAVDVTPHTVVEILKAAGVRPVLFGIHGLNGWRDEPRAASDVDVLVRKKEAAKAVRSLSETYPTLRVERAADRTHFHDGQSMSTLVIDVWKPSTPGLSRVLRHTLSVEGVYEIPELEMGLACKFAAMMTPGYDMAKKYLHAGDVLGMILHNRDALDLDKLTQFGAALCGDGGERIRTFAEDGLAGRKVSLEFMA